MQAFSVTNVYNFQATNLKFGDSPGTHNFVVYDNGICTYFALSANWRSLGQTQRSIPPSVDISPICCHTPPTYTHCNENTDQQFTNYHYTCHLHLPHIWQVRPSLKKCWSTGTQSKILSAGRTKDIVFMSLNQINIDNRKKDRFFSVPAIVVIKGI